MMLMELNALCGNPSAGFEVSFIPFGADCPHGFSRQNEVKQLIVARFPDIFEKANILKNLQEYPTLTP